jgi:hypothetical protein
MVVGGLGGDHGALEVVGLTAGYMDALHGYGYQIVAVPDQLYKRARRAGLVGDPNRWPGMRVEAVLTMEDVVVLAYQGMAGAE